MRTDKGDKQWYNSSLKILPTLPSHLFNKAPLLPPNYCTPLEKIPLSWASRVATVVAAIITPGSSFIAWFSTVPTTGSTMGTAPSLTVPVHAFLPALFSPLLMVSIPPSVSVPISSLILIPVLTRAVVLLTFTVSFGISALPPVMFAGPFGISTFIPTPVLVGISTLIPTSHPVSTPNLVTTLVMTVITITATIATTITCSVSPVTTPVSIPTISTTSVVFAVVTSGSAAATSSMTATVGTGRVMTIPIRRTIITTIPSPVATSSSHSEGSRTKRRILR
eukprot:TRINITY_DN1340_c0_g1_i2.p2 TRINITY_DN1340_c0_g1~~TRINITY_DN1340_c0_g1_i2.p2  ORF type:complete len:279 (-),score=23.38 TRINITY_DN1340_c0_g1_i2:216-1052(-)